jgi:hypothetical protein
MSIVLAFDIERSGATSEYETIAIGASVVNNNFEELDSLFLPGYFDDSSKTPTSFEKRCWEEFWSKNPDTLKKLKYSGNLSKNERQKEMIEEFQLFRNKWETYASENKMNFALVSDNNVYDGGFINELICKHTDYLPIPFSTKREYSSFFETFSQQKGLLMVVDPSFKSDWGLSDRISKLYDLPKPKKEHTHLPSDDAYTIAYDQQVLFGIRDGKIKRLTKSFD